MLYLNNSHELDISSGCLVFSLISGNSSAHLCGVGVTVSLPKLGTDYLLLAQVVFVFAGNAGTI